MMDAHGCPVDIAWFAWIKGTIFVLTIIALLSLRRHPMDESPRFLWAVLIFLMPILGSVVFFIVRPESVPPEQRKTM
jgi:hypothetical protein